MPHLAPTGACGERPQSSEPRPIAWSTGCARVLPLSEPLDNTLVPTISYSVRLDLMTDPKCGNRRIFGEGFNAPHHL